MPSIRVHASSHRLSSWAGLDWSQTLHGPLCMQRASKRGIWVLQVKYHETKMRFLHFLTSVCAIIGGIFTVAGIIDAFVYHGGQAIKKKVDLGKHI